MFNKFEIKVECSLLSSANIEFYHEFILSISSPGDGGKNPKDGKDPKKSSGPQPPNPTAKRILILAQKGDWPACEQALKTLERAKGEGGEKHPLANVSDTVRFYFALFRYYLFSLL